MGDGCERFLSVVTEKRLKEFIETAAKTGRWDKWWEFKIELAEMVARKELEKLLGKAVLAGDEKNCKGIIKQLGRLDRRLARRRVRAGMPKNAL